MSKPARPQPSPTPVKKAINQSATRRAGMSPVAPPAYRPQPTPKILQRKAAPCQPTAAGAKKDERQRVAAPVYRPQPVPKSLQRKAAGVPPPAARPQPSPVAPPVYRPQPTPRVLQKKTLSPLASPHQPPPSQRVPSPTSRPRPTPNVLQKRAAGFQQPSSTGQAKRPPVAPPVYRPQLKGPVQPQMYAPTQARNQPRLPVGQRPSRPAQTAAQGGVRPTAPGHKGVVQPLILVPFTHADQSLIDFAQNRTGGLAPGPVVTGKQLAHKIGVNEHLVLIGHGNGADLYSHENPKHPQLDVMSYAALATFLTDKVLPDNYHGKITVWSCDAARPWGTIPSIAAQLSQCSKTQRQQLQSTSFIKQLEDALTAKNKGYTPNIVGSIGYAGTDKHWAQAEVYADETLKNVGEKKNFAEGFVGTNAVVDESFYDLDDSEGEDYQDGNDYHMGGSYDSSSDNDYEEEATTTTTQQAPVVNNGPTVPQFTNGTEYIDYLMSLAPYGPTRQLSLKERLAKLEAQKRNKF